MYSYPLISVVVPVFNGERYISECIESILEQSYMNLELILVDDGSTDETVQILRKYEKQDKRVVVIQQKNSGVSMARNKALEVAQGDYVCFVDSDDYIDRGYISYYVNLLIKYGGEIALTPQPYKFNADNRLIKYTSEDDSVEEISGDEAAIEMLYYKFAIGPWNKMIARELIEKYRIRFDESLRFGEGFNFSVDCFQRARKVVVGSQKLYNYRVDNPNSVMTKFSVEMIDGSLAAQERIRKQLVKPNKKILKACRYANWHTCCDLLMAMVGCKVAKKYPEKFKGIKKVVHKDALCVFGAPIPLKDKIKGVMFFCFPIGAAKMINRVRIRDFTV